MDVGGQASVCICVCGQYKSLDPSLCLGVGEVSAALLARKNPGVFTLGLTNAPRGAPSPWRQRLIDGCHGAEGQIGKRKGSGSVAYAQHPPPPRSSGNKKRMGVGEEEMRSGRDLLEVTRERERESIQSGSREGFMMLIDG